MMYCYYVITITGYEIDYFRQFVIITTTNTIIIVIIGCQCDW